MGGVGPGDQGQKDPRTSHDCDNTLEGRRRVNCTLQQVGSSTAGWRLVAARPKPGPRPMPKYYRPQRRQAGWLAGCYLAHAEAEG